MCLQVITGNPHVFAGYYRKPPCVCRLLQETPMCLQVITRIPLCVCRLLQETLMCLQVITGIPLCVCRLLQETPMCLQVITGNPHVFAGYYRKPPCVCRLLQETPMCLQVITGIPLCVCRLLQETPMCLQVLSTVKLVHGYLVIWKSCESSPSSLNYFRIRVKFENFPTVYFNSDIYFLY